jgi:hypothetical protein
MIGKWFAKRRLKGHLKGCNFVMANTILVKQFAGSVIPNELAKLLDAFGSNPGTETALDLLLYDPKFLTVFTLARSGGFTEHLFKQGDLK